MGIFNFFKRKKKEKKEKVKKVEKGRGGVTPPVQKEFRVLKGSHISEQATDLTKLNKYVFRVRPKANKIEIKKEVERLYRVDVVGVNIINIPRKVRRLGRTRGFRSGYKKAIITLKHGQKIAQTKT